MTVLEAVLSFAAILLLCDFIEPAIYQRANREKLETLCIEESPYKTYFDNVLTNILITLPIVLVFFVLFTLAEAVI
jgi:hypothetical protein